MLKLLKKIPKTLPSLFFLSIVVNNFYWIYNFIRTRGFYNPDCFQHTHIAWNMSQGLTLYKDFFEHHGPLYSLLNGFILSKLKNPASIETLFLLREISFFSSIACVILVFLIAKNIFRQNNLALLSIAIYSMWEIVHSVSIHIRPDILQNLFMLLAIYLFFKAKDFNNKVFFFLSGFSFAIMLLFNFKTLIILAALIFSFVFLKINKQNHLSYQDYYFIFIGFLLPIIFISIYFLEQNSFKEFIASNIFTNFKIFANKSKRAYSFFADIFFSKDIVLTLLIIPGIFFIDKFNLKQNILLSTFIFSLYGSLKGFYPHYALIFLPFASIFITHFLYKLYKLAKNQKKLSIFFLLSIILCINLTNHKKILFLKKAYKHFALTQQELTLEWILKHTNRNDEVGKFDNNCIAYIFNKDALPQNWFLFNEYNKELNNNYIKKNKKTILAISAHKNSDKIEGYTRIMLQNQTTKKIYSDCLFVNKEIYNM